MKSPACLLLAVALPATLGAQIIGGRVVDSASRRPLAGVTGAVRLAYIVNKKGIIEPASVEILLSSDPLFSLSAIQGVNTMKFEPAEFHGSRVRQYVQQSFTFCLSQGESGAAAPRCRHDGDDPKGIIFTAFSVKRETQRRP